MEDAKTTKLLPIYADGGIGARILAAMESYRKEYLYSPEDGPDHEPTEFEQVLLEDFLNGAFTGEVSAILQEAARVAAPPQPADVPHDVVRAGVGIKPLVWSVPQQNKPQKITGDLGGSSTVASTVIGSFTVASFDDDKTFHAMGTGDPGKYGSMDEAKAAVQAYHDRRVRSCLIEDAGAIPQDLVRLVIAARNVAYTDPDPDALKALDQAAEAFASCVRWDEEPDDRALATPAPSTQSS